MAKQIKVVKCPQCGSVKNTEIKEDFYKCSNCGTEFFLDNDNINVNVNNTYSPPKTNVKPLAIVGVFIGFLFFLMIFSGLFKHSSVSTDSIKSDKNYSERVSDFSYAFDNPSTNNLSLVFIIKREYSTRNEIIVRFYDPLNGKILNDVIMPEWKDSPGVRIRKFSNGKVYFTANQSINYLNKIYELDEKNQTVKDVTNEMISGYPELSSGLAEARIIDSDEGDGFSLTTNNGDKYYFYPIIKGLYKDYNPYNQAEAKMGRSTEAIYYAITEKTEEHPSQLLKIWYQMTPGYPICIKKPSWSHSDTYYGNPPKNPNYDKSFIKYFFQWCSGITHFVDLTPDRLYFDAEVIAYDQANLYIAGKPNANKSTDPFVQKIDINNGKVLWTYNLPHSDLIASAYRDFFIYHNGIVFQTFPSNSRLIIILDNNGKAVKELELNALFK